jgi:hypothetical protein
MAGIEEFAGEEHFNQLSWFPRINRLPKWERPVNYG